MIYGNICHLFKKCHFEKTPPLSDHRRVDKGWAVKRSRPSKKVWCWGLGLCLEFDFGQGLRCGLSFKHCRFHWIMAAWELSCFLTLFFLVPLCWYAVSKRQMLLIVGVNKHLFQMAFLVTFMTPPLNYIFIILRHCRCYSKTKTTKYCLKHEGKSHPCHPWQTKRQQMVVHN